MAAQATAGRATWVAGTAAALLVVLYVFARYGDAVNDFYFLDDWWLLHEGWQATWKPWCALFAIFQPTHTGFALYRPLTQTGYFALLVSLFGLDSSPAHALQVGVFALNALLVMRLAARQCGSRVAGLCTALLYAAAPGHGAAVYWLAAFSMTGSALVLWLLVNWWDASAGRRRRIGATALQAIALLCGEYGVAGPGLLLAMSLFGRRRERLADALRDLAGPLALVGLYVAAKGTYIAVYGSRNGYALTGNPLRILANLGDYAVATVNVALLLFRRAALSLPADGLAAGLAIALLTAVGASMWWARQGVRGLRPLALGGAIFVAALLPVLPLSDHRYDYFIGVAAGGAALALVAAARWAAAGRNALAVGLTGLVLGIDALTGDAAMRQTDTVSMARASALDGESYLLMLFDASRPDVRAKLWVPKSPLTSMAFQFAGAQNQFFRPFLTVRVFDTEHPPEPGPEDVVLLEPPCLERGAHTPWRQPRFDGVRAALTSLHAAYAALAIGG